MLVIQSQHDHVSAGYSREPAAGSLSGSDRTLATVLTEDVERLLAEVVFSIVAGGA